MFDKLTSVENRYEQMAAEMGDPAVQADNAKFRAHSKAVAEMQPLVEAFREYKRVITQINENEDLTNTNNPDDWARISGKKGERIVYIRTIIKGKQGTEAGRSIDTVANTGQYL